MEFVRQVNPVPERSSYLEIAIRIQQQVGWLQITVKDVRRVQGFESPERLGWFQNAAIRSERKDSPHLVNKVLTMIVTKFLGSDDTMEVSFHELLNEINFFKVCQGWRFQNVEDGDDVLVVEMAKQLDLAEGSKAKHGVLKGRYTLYGYPSARWNMDR